MEYFCCMTGNTVEARSYCISWAESDMQQVWFICSPYVVNECAWRWLLHQMFAPRTSNSNAQSCSNFHNSYPTVHCLIMQRGVLTCLHQTTNEVVIFTPCSLCTHTHTHTQLNHTYSMSPPNLELQHKQRSATMPVIQSNYSIFLTFLKLLHSSCKNNGRDWHICNAEMLINKDFTLCCFHFVIMDLYLNMLHS
jgi:hypothetical protein